ncbi:MAG: hypothetical protein ACREFN_10000 [Acetobacteraceae bacterium]
MQLLADRSARLSRVYEGLPELNYSMHGKQYMVTASGRICMHRKKTNISTDLAGQPAGLKEVEDDVWLVSFMPNDLGHIDLEQGTLQPVDNPFGPRLSPVPQERSVTYASAMDSARLGAG